MTRKNHAIRNKKVLFKTAMQANSELANYSH